VNPDAALLAGIDLSERRRPDAFPFEMELFSRFLKSPGGDGTSDMDWQARSKVS
jgi:hypothetical protein